MEVILARQPWAMLHPALRSAGVDVGAAEARLREFCRRVIEWNRSVSNIMSRHDEARIVERHVLESVAPAHWLAEGGPRRWIDFGSGAGFPAIPLAIAGVGGSWTLVESRRTKTLFIRKMLQDMTLMDFEVLNERLETIAQASDSPRHDGFVSRATMRLGPTLALAGRLVSPGGFAFLWKGSGREREMAEDRSWCEAWEFTGLMGVGTGANVVARFTRKPNS